MMPFSGLAGGQEGLEGGTPDIGPGRHPIA